MRPFLILLVIVVPSLSNGQLPSAIRSKTKRHLPTYPVKNNTAEREQFFSCTPIETPAIPGDDWLPYLQKNVTIEDSLSDIIPPGSYPVNVMVVIGRTGCVELVKCISDSSGFCLGEMAANIVARYPGQWTPATHNGRFIKVYRLLPLTFIISKPEEECDELPLIARTNTGLSQQLSAAGSNK